MGKLKVTLTRSTIGAIPKQVATAKAMGLTKMHRSVIMPDNDAVRGMIKKIEHLVTVEEIEE